MSQAEIERFLALLQADYDAPFRSERIPNLERHLTAIKRVKDANDAWERKWKELALEDKEIKDEWLALGATWRCWHIYTIWTYEGEEFYRWAGGFNRPSVVDEIVRVREADERLRELINEGGTIR